jgi:hypothetical protein
MKLKVHITCGSKERNLQPRDIKEASSTTWLLTCTIPITRPLCQLKVTWETQKLIK